LTYDLDLQSQAAKVKVDLMPKIKVKGQTVNRRALTDKRTDTHTDATKRIISPATRSIINETLKEAWLWSRDPFNYLVPLKYFCNG